MAGSRGGVPRHLPDRPGGVGYDQCSGTTRCRPLIYRFLSELVASRRCFLRHYSITFPTFPSVTGRRRYCEYDAKKFPKRSMATARSRAHGKVTMRR